ncbi:MAG: hypothetical protein WHT65_04095 [Pseudothermotoga sp.]
MRGFTVVELTISMILLFIVTGICVLLLNQSMRTSEIVLNRVNVFDELSRISSSLQRELLKAGPTAKRLELEDQSATFTVVVPFAQSSYGTFGASSELIYNLRFSNGTLYLQITDLQGIYNKLVVLGEISEFKFLPSTDNNRIIQYELVKMVGNHKYKLTSSVILSNVW